MPFLSCANDCSTNGVKTPPSCEVSPRDGGISRLVFLTDIRCSKSEFELNFTDLEFWRNALFRCEIVTTGRIKGQKPKGSVTSEKLTSCTPEQPTGGTKTITFMDYNSYEGLFDYDFYEEIYRNQSRWLVSAITCDGRIYPAVPFTIDVDEVVPEDSKAPSHFDGAISIDYNGIFKPFYWPELLDLLNNYDEKCFCDSFDRNFDCNETYPGFISMDFSVPSDLVLPTLAEIAAGEKCQYELGFSCCGNNCAEDAPGRVRSRVNPDSKDTSRTYTYVSQQYLGCETIECFLKGFVDDYFNDGNSGALNYTYQMTAPNTLSVTMEISSLQYYFSEDCFGDEISSGDPEIFCEAIRNSVGSFRACRCSYFNDELGAIPTDPPEPDDRTPNIPCPDGKSRVDIDLIGEIFINTGGGNYPSNATSFVPKTFGVYKKRSLSDDLCVNGYSEFSLEFQNDPTVPMYLSGIEVPTGVGCTPNLPITNNLINYGGATANDLANGFEQFLLDWGVNQTSAYSSLSDELYYERTGNTFRLIYKIDPGCQDNCGSIVNLIYNDAPDRTGNVYDSRAEQSGSLQISFNNDAQELLWFRNFFVGSPACATAGTYGNGDPNTSGQTATELADAFEVILNGAPWTSSYPGVNYTRIGNTFSIGFPADFTCCDEIVDLIFENDSGGTFYDFDDNLFTIDSFLCGTAGLSQTGVNHIDTNVICCEPEPCFEVTDIENNFPGYGIYNNIGGNGGFLANQNQIKQNFIDFVNNEIQGAEAIDNGEITVLFDNLANDLCCGEDVFVGIIYEIYGGVNNELIGYFHNFNNQFAEDRLEYFLGEDYNDVEDYPHIKSSPFWCCDNYDDDEICPHPNQVKYTICFDNDTYGGDPTRYNIDWGSCQPYGSLIYPLNGGLWEFNTNGGDLVTSIQNIGAEIETEFDNNLIFDFNYNVINDAANNRVCLELFVPIHNQRYDDGAFTNTQMNDNCVCSCPDLAPGHSNRRLPGYGFIPNKWDDFFEPIATVYSDYGETVRDAENLIPIDYVDIGCCGCPDDDTLGQESCPPNTAYFTVSFDNNPQQEVTLSEISIGNCNITNAGPYEAGSGSTAFELADGFEWYLNNVFPLSLNVDYERDGTDFTVYIEDATLTEQCCTDGVYIEYLLNDGSFNPAFNTNDVQNIISVSELTCCNFLETDTPGEERPLFCPKMLPMCVRPSENPIPPN